LGFARAFGGAVSRFAAGVYAELKPSSTLEATATAMAKWLAEGLNLAHRRMRDGWGTRVVVADSNRNRNSKDKGNSNSNRKGNSNSNSKGNSNGNSNGNSKGGS
jgi:hypothetical protein